MLIAREVDIILYLFVKLSGRYSKNAGEYPKCKAGYYGRSESDLFVPCPRFETCHGKCSAGLPHFHIYNEYVGYYCPKGSSSPTEEKCPTGSYSLIGAASIDDCISCEAGKWYNDNSQTTCTLACPLGQIYNYTIYLFQDFIVPEIAKYMDVLPESTERLQVKQMKKKLVLAPCDAGYQTLNALEDVMLNTIVLLVLQK